MLDSDRSNPVKKLLKRARAKPATPTGHDPRPSKPHPPANHPLSSGSWAKFVRAWRVGRFSNAVA